MALISTEVKPIVSSKERLARYEAKYGAHRAALRDDSVLGDVISKGYSVLPNYWNEQQCLSAIAQIDKAMKSESCKIWRDQVGADKRIFGANRVAKELDLYADPQIDAWIKQLYGINELHGFSMAGRIDTLAGNLGSGEGWHRDSCVTYQFKAILYLSDVEHDQGPFQYRPYSHSNNDIVLLEQEAKASIDENRLDPYAEYIESHALDEVTGKRGTLILADTRGVHRGKPIQRGSRYALTNYYWELGIPQHVSPHVNGL